MPIRRMIDAIATASRCSPLQRTQLRDRARMIEQIDHTAVNRRQQLAIAISSGYPTYFPYAFLAGAEAAKGDDAEAKPALAEARRLNPQLTIEWLTTETLTPSIIIDGLRKAGLPEE